MNSQEWTTTVFAKDPAWQTYLTEEEKKHCLQWAAQQIDQCVSQNRTDIKAKLRLVNELIGQGKIERADIIKIVLGEL